MLKKERNKERKKETKKECEGICAVGQNCSLLGECVSCVCGVCIGQVSSLHAGYAPLSGPWPAGRPPTGAPWLEFLKTIICSVCACGCACERTCACFQTSKASHTDAKSV